MTGMCVYVHIWGLNIFMLVARRFWGKCKFQVFVTREALYVVKLYTTPQVELYFPT